METAQLTDLLAQMVRHQASDLFLTTGAPPHIKVKGRSWPLKLPALQRGEAQSLAYSTMSEAQIAEFEQTMECNIAYTADGIGRFRINVYRQRGETAMVARHINDTVPGFEELGLPPAVRDLSMAPRGLILVVGAAGSGKSTTLAAMMNHRASHSHGHILTVEDPIEYLFHHDQCTVDQREIGIDTLSFAQALRNAMRQAPDVIMIGEIRDRETMEHALAYAETGHLCVSTLHAANASQAMRRILNFFPESMHPQVQLDLSLNLQGVISQRLLPGLHGDRVLAAEVLLHSAYVADLIQRGSVDELKRAIEKSGVVGMQSFDQVLLQLCKDGRIDQDTALANADSRTDLSLRMRVHSSYDPR
ncbi:MAG: PilT/PilU family type 4a pilus ATPase [Burkholderiaceae bacterium]|nr:PilT/PilU family type 4a pilus ATPase [Burkholderiaceae bacterium]